MAGWYTYFLRNKSVCLVPLGGFLFMVLAAYPGFMSPDSLDQYQQALASHYTDWHPPFMAWIWQKMLWIVNGPQLMLVLINLLYWSGVALLAAGMERRRYWVYISAFLPPLINFLGVIWKDSLLFSLLVFTCALWIYSHKTNKPAAPRKKLAVTVVGLLLLAACLRYNAMAAVMPLLALVIWFAYPKYTVLRKSIIALIAGVSMFLLSMGINSMLTDSKSYPGQQLMLYDLAGINYYTEDVQFPAYVEQHLTKAAMPFFYKPDDGGTAFIFGQHCVSQRPEDIETLQNSWKLSIRAHPMAWLHHKWWAFKELQHSDLPVFYYMQPNPYGFTLHKNMFNQAFRSWVDNPGTLLMYHGWIYLLITMLLCLLAILFRRRSEMITVFFVAASGAMYSLAYLPLSPSSDFRYHYWTIGAAWIGTLLFVKSFFNPTPVY